MRGYWNVIIMETESKEHGTPCLKPGQENNSSFNPDSTTGFDDKRREKYKLDQIIKFGGDKHRGIANVDEGRGGYKWALAVHVSLLPC